MNTVGSKEYWKGFTDAKKHAEKGWERARIELNSRFINTIENAKDVKGIGSKTHQNLVEFVMADLMESPGYVAPIKKQITNEE